MKLETAGRPHFVAAQEALLVLDHVQLRPFAEHRVHYNVLRGRGPRRCDECPSVNGHARYLGPQVEGSPGQDGFMSISLSTAPKLDYNSVQ